jgi:hypothetical protein
MGVDQDHMDYSGLTGAAPPAYGEYVFGQAAMREVERRFGLRAITFDDYLANPERSRRQMSHWLRGVGHEASRQMGQGSRADLLALVGTTPHSARAMTGAQRAPGCRRRWQVFKNLDFDPLSVFEGPRAFSIS